MEAYSYPLIVAYFDKTISDEGLNELQEWLERSPDHQEQFRETLQILEASKLYFVNSGDTSLAWEKVRSHINAEHPHRQVGFPKKWLAYAATLLLLCGVAFWYVGRSPKVASAAYGQISNPEGRQTRILLPDSSLVYLAGGSTIRFPKNFGRKTRMISLNGEAFFDVVHGNRPFVIKSGAVTTVVLGTSFNVKAFQRDHKVTVSVNTGKVGVLNKVNGKNVLISYLLPNDQLELNTITGNTSKSRADAEQTSAWIRNHFIFNNAMLYDILASLEHRYGRKIELMDPGAGNIRVTAKFKNMALKDVLAELMTLSGLRYIERNGQLFIYQPNLTEGKNMK
ncbi:FecR family protein [Pedobacter deserti]|uniref:FecR family protein n=1 Tax=Pedobacter deserti TaxID=2817382 RepID=UPI00210C3063|nr:FecR domain-containing protein [Pedobacter sp. SYSU D00382]